MDYNTAFACLQIPITKDIQTIKKAYQQLVPRHHPEEDPEGFMQLHQAYKTALGYARGKQTSTSHRTSFDRNPFDFQREPDDSEFGSLFENLEESSPADPAQQKKEFLRKLLLLRLHRLPIPIKVWSNFFESTVFQSCRNEPECLEKLFELLDEKIHTFSGFRFLLNRLWELENWQRGESLDNLANGTQNCIAQLRKQYKHFLNPSILEHLPPWGSSLLWNYQVFPFYFKLIVSVLLIPLLSFGCNGLLMLLVCVFYILEILISGRKKNRNLGCFSSGYRNRKGIPPYKKNNHEELRFVVAMHAIIFHVFGCLLLMEKLYG